MELVGRIRERSLFQELTENERANFVAIYGRRRIGKTFLIKNHFKTFEFYHSGVANVETKQQLKLFHQSLCQFGKKEFPLPKNWFEAFDLLKVIIQNSRRKKKVVFIDEMPWLQTQRSNFLAALEYFWNHWASERTDLIFIVCGSSSTWIINKLINNKAGLHNRITHKIHLKPFTLSETELFLSKKGIQWNRYQLVKAYMVFGGIPYYLEQLQKGKSIDQNINDLLFDEESVLFNEFQNLYASLFSNHETYIEIVNALATKNKGLTRNEIVPLVSINTGGTLSTILEDLELSGFIRKYYAVGKKQRDALYQLVDTYSLFYFNFLNQKNRQKNQWIQLLGSPKLNAWGGYAFEIVCLWHIETIKKAMGIEGIHCDVYSWSNTNAQIDLIFDRKDQIVNVFEIKFSENQFILQTNYLLNLMNKVNEFKSNIPTKKAIQLTMITTYGLAENENKGMIPFQLTMEDLF
ncbi:MAG: ATP-binding protein [Flavobacteriales bacterium]|nr:ATP-binding protein [Flavobacteriales bacterium]